ncbi:enoyl-CoA hydratase/isomerase family protein [Kribbella sandramycini]|uniref:Enoyl-CoA hydratase/carnithine racemase n=1 Tax=Kribbella sandramycini TaxID=60450 RepID=A0A7Y4L0G5_9ACTN|nr:enoyl-CoA hydratase/isomerase family protein [Kribbella sandramycini]MBB6565791.1 enoyl-CoA hydratase/carnithine racemase [Kribbella sandramycini]NOL42055.1 enoyl-CoA hydratase/isomerase family protein [Kribbella sandramycini]
MDDLGFQIRSGVVARLVIDRVRKRNALTRAMWEALPGLLAELAADDEVKVLVVTGAGPSFSAGADISELISGSDPADPMAELRAFNLRAQEALREFPRPTIAMVRGHCIGGGLEIAVNCDFRFAARGSSYGVTPARIGVVYPPAAVRVLLDLVGPATTKYLLFSGDLLSAEQAEQKGLVDRVVDDIDLESTVDEFAATLVSRSQLTIRSAKETVNALLAGADADSAALARYRETIASGELAEGIKAFTEKRSPRFPWT